MKKHILIGVIACLAIPSQLRAASLLPVIIPDSSGRVTAGPAGLETHTRIRILVTANATDSTATQINTPATIRSAYGLPATGGAGAIAIVDAYNFPTALNDFNVFSGSYGLPKEASKNVMAKTNRSLEVVYAEGQPMSGGSYIASWNMEEALDIEWAHAIAPRAKIYLVEAASDSMSDLLNAVLIAAKLPGVREVSMSWGGDETQAETYYDWVFDTPSVTYFASGGDAADEVEYPSASPNVISVGGTSLNRSATGALTSETGWSETGCGISQFEPRPEYQNVVAAEVGGARGSNDVSFLADPNTGVGIYDSTELYGESGWWIVGGTSVGSPCWAAVANLASVANKPAANTAAESARLYKNLGSSTTFRDITAGQANDVLCGPGWDQLTGIGSPMGLKGK